MTARPAVNPNNYLKRDGSNTITGLITPDADTTHNFGSNALRFDRINAQAINAAGGPNNVTRSAQGGYSIIGGRNIGPGTNTFRMGLGTFPPIGMLANVYSYYATGTATMALDGGGSFMAGSAFTYTGAGQIAEILTNASSFGSFTGGYAYTLYASVNSRSTIRNQAAGAFLWAYPQAAGTHTCRIYQTSSGAFLVGRSTGYGDVNIVANSAPGSFTQGYVVGTSSTGTGNIRSLAGGVFVQGFVNANTAAGTAELSAAAQGSFVQGYAAGSSSIRVTGSGSRGAFAQGRVAGAGSAITASSAGAFAQGRSNAGGIIRVAGSSFGGFAQGSASGAGGLIEVTEDGGFAHGRSRNSYAIQATGSGSFAVGDSYGGAIVASAQNAAQFGPGTNATADSLQVGSDFSAKANGQHAGAFDSFTLAAAATTFVATANDMIITGDAGTNTIATITGGINGQFLCLLFVDGNVTVTDDNTHAADSIDLSGAFTSADDTVLLLKYDGTSWYEVNRSVN